MTTIVDYNHQAVEIPGTRRPGQTGIYRRVGYENQLVGVPPSKQNMRTVYDAFQYGLKVSTDAHCLGKRQYDQATKKFGEYQWMSYETVHRRLTNFGSGLIQLHHQLFPDLDEQARRQWPVGIWGPNRPEWTIAGLACDAYSLISVGLYDALEIDAIAYSINHSEVSIVVASASHLKDLIENLEKMPKVKVIISMDRLDSNSAVMSSQAGEKGVGLLEFEEVELIGEVNRFEHVPPKPDDIFLIGYTSGTTGPPKGAMITHANYVVFMATSEEVYPLLKEDTVLSQLPLGHAFGRLIEATVFSVGARFGYGSGSPTRLLEDLQHLRPTMFAAVPRLLNRIYTRARAETVDAPGETGVLARRAMDAKLASYRAGNGVHHAEWDRTVFQKTRKLVGGNVRLILMGSAPSSSDTLAFCRMALCCEISEIYSQTETSGVGTAIDFRDVTPGHIGPPAPGCEIKLVDVPELNYFTTDKPHPRGEICIRGPSILKGYLKDEKKTRETIDDEGFLHTADIAVLNPNGTLTLIDRAKHIFKLSQGEFVAPEKVESQLLARMPLIQQIVVHGDAHQNCLVAIMIPHLDVFLPLAQQVLGTEVSDADPNALRDGCDHPIIRQTVLQMIADAGKSAQLKTFEIPKAVFIEPKPLTVEGGQLTPTFKTKRQPVIQAYRAQIAALYNEIRQQQARL